MKLLKIENKSLGKFRLEEKDFMHKMLRYQLIHSIVVVQQTSFHAECFRIKLV